MGVYVYERSEEQSRCCLQWLTGDGVSRAAGRAARSSQASVMVASEALLVNPRSSLTLLESFPFATAVSPWVLSLSLWMAGDALLGAARPWPGLAGAGCGELRRRTLGLQLAPCLACLQGGHTYSL